MFQALWRYFASILRLFRRYSAGILKADKEEDEEEEEDMPHLKSKDPTSSQVVKKTPVRIGIP